MSKSHLSSKRSFAYALLLLNTILWGLSPPIIKVALNFVSINQFLLGRYILASLIFLPIYFLTQKKAHLEIRNLKLVILLALLGTPLTLIPLYEGIKLTSSIESSILTATGPLLIIIGGRIFLHEKITQNEKIGLIIALIGTILLTLGPVVIDGPGFKISLLGNFLILGSNLIWTAFLLLVKKLKVDASQISLVSYLTAIPVFAILLFFEPSSLNTKYLILNTSAILGIVYMAVAGSIIAFWAYTKGQEYVEASEAAVFTYLQPLITFPLAYFWLHESISSVGLAACLLIAAGVYVSEYHG
ncbi:DMT family transporter [Candidatus Collierbacteria bacterium]|nr:DMT family transporter [Candidatus Collierbacteria bacterium]